MSQNEHVAAPESTAVRVALWRALHVETDRPPHVLEDKVGLKLAAPDEGWRDRPDMSPFTKPFRASILARARFIEDLVTEQVARGVGQYVILGAGLDTFAQRRPEIASRLLVFEVDRRGPQAWKQRRLVELGFGLPPWLRFVPVDFEAGESLWHRLGEAGFATGQPAVVASTGVSMYHVVHAADRFGGPRGASRNRASGGRREGERNPLHQFLHADRDARAGPRIGLSRRPTRIGRRPCAALFHGQDGWTSATEQFRRTNGGDNVKRAKTQSLLPSEWDASGPRRSVVKTRGATSNALRSPVDWGTRTPTTSALL